MSCALSCSILLCLGADAVSVPVNGRNLGSLRGEREPDTMGDTWGCNAPGIMRYHETVPLGAGTTCTVRSKLQLEKEGLWRHRL